MEVATINFKWKLQQIYSLPNNSKIHHKYINFPIFFIKRFDGGNRNCYRVLSSRNRREKQDRIGGKPAVPRTNIIPSG
jgi:hypothetical protein